MSQSNTHILSYHLKLSELILSVTNKTITVNEFLVKKEVLDDQLVEDLIP